MGFIWDFWDSFLFIKKWKPWTETPREKDLHIAPPAQYEKSVLACTGIDCINCRHIGNCWHIGRSSKHLLFGCVLLYLFLSPLKKNIGKNCSYNSKWRDKSNEWDTLVRVFTKTDSPNFSWLLHRSIFLKKLHACLLNTFRRHTWGLIKDPESRLYLHDRNAKLALFGLMGFEK